MLVGVAEEMEGAVLVEVVVDVTVEVIEVVDVTVDVLEDEEGGQVEGKPEGGSLVHKTLK